MEHFRLTELLAKVKELNPAAFPFCHKLGETVARIDDLLDKDNPGKPERLSQLIIELVTLSHTDAWARPRMIVILSMWQMAHVHWLAANKMPPSPTRGVVKDKFNDILLWAISETQSAEVVTNIIVNYPFEQT